MSKFVSSSLIFSAAKSVAVWLGILVLTLACNSAYSEPAVSAEQEPDDDVASCAADDCEKPAAYSLKIIARGEGKPRSKETGKKGLQDNRRVDVTVARKVAVEQAETRSAELDNGGSVWITKDPSSLDRRLAVETAASAAITDGEFVSPVEFTVTSNYAAFIERWEVRIFSPGATVTDKPLQILELPVSPVSSTVSWSGDFVSAGSARSSKGKSRRMVAGREFEYAVRAIDQHGNFDQTKNSKFSLVLPESESAGAGKNGKLPALELEELDGTNADVYEELALQGIALSGSKVRIHGQDISNADKVLINDVKINLASDNTFVVEYLLPTGVHEFSIVGESRDKGGFKKSLKVDLSTDYFFMVALADLTVGENTVTGSIEPLAVDQHHYGGDIFVDGRLAFYLKGKVKGKYLVTAQLDTGTEDVSELFDDFHRKDPNSVFRRLDPDQYYLVYGDDSTLYDDTDSQGKLYIRAEWDKSRILWGNYNTAFSGSELAPFNRSLYGVQAVHRSMANTGQGDTRSELSAFASEAQSAFRHNEFLGTGGSLYYLRDKDIVRGSEKVWVEVRQSGTTRVVERIPLVAGRDYDIDDFQGRLILTRPLTSVSGQVGPSIIRDEPLAGDDTWLVVDYEYIPDNFDSGNATAGVRAKHWLSDNLALGATWAHENRSVDDYDIKGVDLTLKKSDNTYIKSEFATSKSSQTAGSFQSTDGGLNFTPFSSNSGVTSGQAYSIEARASVRDFVDPDSDSPDVASSVPDVSVGAWARRREAGFSTANVDSDVDTTDTGLEAIAQVNEKLSLSARATRLDREAVDRETEAAVQLDYVATERLTLGTELRAIREENMANQSQGSATVGGATLAAGKAAYDVSEKVNVYAIGQGTVSRSGSYQRNNLYTLGTELRPDDRFRLNGEVSTGDRGDGLSLGAEWQVSDSYSVYSNVSSAIDQQSVGNHALTVGQRKGLSKQLQVYSEHQFSHEDKRSGVSHSTGLDYAFTRYTSVNLSLQMAQFEDDNGGTTDRDAVSFGLEHKRQKLKAGSRVEYRRDRGAGIDTDQWVLTNRFEYRRSAALRWQGKLNASITRDRLSDSENARFVEAGIGFALRPVSHDRLNLLGRLTWLRDLPPLSQSAAPDEASTIASIEGLYDLSQHWGFGGKVAHRKSEIRLLRDSGSWISNDATLLALRLHYRVPFGLDTLLSYHWLNSDETDSLRQGVLFSIGRNVGDHLKFSVGYNFTGFDDNLADDSYDVRGWFLNLAGTY